MDEIQQVPNQSSITPAPPITTYPSHQVSTPNKTPFLTVIIVLLVGLTSYFGYQYLQLKQQISSQPPTTTIESPLPTADSTFGSNSMANWKTYINSTYGFSIQYPIPDSNDPTEKYNKYTDELIEINGLDSLIIRVEPILTNTDAITWWKSQSNIDIYSNKPTSCFSIETSQTIKSLYEPNNNVIDFGKDVVILDGLQSPESKVGSCPEPGTVRIILIQLENKLLRITYTWSSMSEKILSTFKFTK